MMELMAGDILNFKRTDMEFYVRLLYNCEGIGVSDSLLDDTGEFPCDGAIVNDLYRFALTFLVTFHDRRCSALVTPEDKVMMSRVRDLWTVLNRCRFPWESYMGKSFIQADSEWEEEISYITKRQRLQDRLNGVS